MLVMDFKFLNNRFIGHSNQAEHFFVVQMLKWHVYILTAAFLLIQIKL